MDLALNFAHDLHAQPVWVRAWAVWMFVATVVAPIVMWRYGAARRDYLLVASSTVVLLVAVPLWHSFVGYVRVLGLPHLPVWTPLAVYLYWRRKHFSSPWQLRWAVSVLLATIVVSLAFDYADAGRFMLGERAPVNIPSTR